WCAAGDSGYLPALFPAGRAHSSPGRPFARISLVCRRAGWNQYCGPRFDGWRLATTEPEHLDRCPDLDYCPRLARDSVALQNQFCLAHPGRSSGGRGALLALALEMLIVGTRKCIKGPKIKDEPYS